MRISSMVRVGPPGEATSQSITACNRAETSLIMKEGEIIINRNGGAGGAQNGNR